MLNLNTIRELEQERQRLAQATEAFLAAGGTITRPAGITAGLTSAHWRDNPQNGIPGARKRPLIRHEQGLADNIRSYVSVGMTEHQICAKTGVNSATLRKIAKRHRIALPQGREAA
ncbi:hypothetical protein ACE0DR_00890 [Azotobacter sp. CWF10]